MSKTQRLHIPKNINPPLDLCITLRVPSDPEHLSILYGLVEWATFWSNWDRDDAHSGTELAWLYERILATITICSTAPSGGGGNDEGEMMIRQNPDNPCIVETSADNIHWCTLIDLSLCFNFGASSSPNTIQPPPKPGGGKQQTCALLNANSTLLLPSLVSTGDAITLDSADGSGYDGAEFDFGPLWRLPNGDQYVGGLDVGFPTTKTGDPLPATHHMQLIATIGTTPVYIPLTVGSPATVPAGVSNAQVYIQVNDSDISNNQGSYQLCATVTNNQAAGWTHVFDFTTAPGGWANYLGGTSGVWSLGSGWVTTDVPDIPDNVEFRSVSIQRAFTSTFLTSIKIEFDYTFGTTIDGGSTAQGFVVGLSGTNTTLITRSMASPPSNGAHAETYPIGANQDMIILGLATDEGRPGSWTPTGAATISKVTVQGTGTDPF